MVQRHGHLRAPVIHAVVLGDGAGVVGKKAVEKTGVIHHVGIVGDQRAQHGAAHFALHTAAQVAQKARIDERAQHGLLAAHQVDQAVECGLHVIRPGADDRHAQLGQMGRTTRLHCTVRGHGGVAAFGIAGDEQLAVVCHLVLCAPDFAGGEQVDHRSCRGRSQKIGVGRAARGAKTHVIWRYHHIAQRSEYHGHFARHCVVAGRLGVAEDGAMLVAEHRAGAARRLLRHADEARGTHLAAIGIERGVFKPPRHHGIARHHALHARAVLRQCSGDLSRRNGAQRAAGQELAPPGRVGGDDRRLDHLRLWAATASAGGKDGQRCATGGGTQVTQEGGERQRGAQRGHRLTLG